VIKRLDQEANAVLHLLCGLTSGAVPIDVSDA
jgi:hypothetical protein